MHTVVAIAAVEMLNPVIAKRRNVASRRGNRVKVRAEAMRMLRDQGEAQAYEAAGDAEGQRLALSKGRNWEQLAEMEVAGWSPVITTLADLKTEAPLEPLARGHQLAQYSVDTRSAVMNLLATVHGPTKPTP